MILDIQNVSCRYTSREKDTLTGVNLHIEEGEMVLIAGRSGCGKSTLVKAVTGLLDKEDGSIDGKIFLDGKDTAAMSAEEIGVSQLVSENRILECLCNILLSYKRLKASRSVLSCRYYKSFHTPQK